MCFSGFVDFDKIENYSEHREKHISKGRGTAFLTAVHQMDEYISNPEMFRSNALANHVQVKTERDVERQLNIKEEKSDDFERPGKATKTPNKSGCATDWPQEKKALVEQIVSLKSENQAIHLKLTNKLSECSSLSRKIRVLTSESIALKKKIEELLADSAAKSMQSKQTISELKRKNELLEALNKQLQTGIDQQRQLKDKQKGSSDIYRVEKILERKKIKKVWYYKIRWEGFGPEDDTWEKESNLLCPQELEAFKKSVTKK